MNQSTDEGCTSKGLKYTENQACIHSSGFSMFIGQWTWQFGMLCSSYTTSSRTRCWRPSLSHVRQGDWTKADIRCLIWWRWGGGKLFLFLFVFNRVVYVRNTQKLPLMEERCWACLSRLMFITCSLHVYVYYMYCRSSINNCKKKVVKTGIYPII